MLYAGIDRNRPDSKKLAKRVADEFGKLLLRLEKLECGLTDEQKKRLQPFRLSIERRAKDAAVLSQEGIGNLNEFMKYRAREL